MELWKKNDATEEWSTRPRATYRPLPSSIFDQCCSQVVLLTGAVPLGSLKARKSIDSSLNCLKNLRRKSIEIVENLFTLFTWHVTWPKRKASRTNAKNPTEFTWCWIIMIQDITQSIASTNGLIDFIATENDISIDELYLTNEEEDFFIDDSSKCNLYLQTLIFLKHNSEIIFKCIGKGLKTYLILQYQKLWILDQPIYPNHDHSGLLDLMPVLNHLDSSNTTLCTIDEILSCPFDCLCQSMQQNHRRVSRQWLEEFLEKRYDWELENQRDVTSDIAKSIQIPLSKSFFRMISSHVENVKLIEINVEEWLYKGEETLDSLVLYSSRTILRCEAEVLKCMEERKILLVHSVFFLYGEEFWLTRTMK